MPGKSKNKNRIQSTRLSVGIREVKESLRVY